VNSNKSSAKRDEVMGLLKISLQTVRFCEINEWLSGGIGSTRKCRDRGVLNSLRVEQKKTYSSSSEQCAAVWQPIHLETELARNHYGLQADGVWQTICAK